MDGPRRPSSNRRPEDDHVQSPVESSSDELAAASDYEDRERRRSSYLHPPQRPQPRTRSYSDSESTDELAMDADVYWRRNPPSPSQDESLPEDGEDDYRDADYVDEYRSEYRSEDENVERDESDERDRAVEETDRSPTPVPPPPPPQPERLNYKQKFLLKGHTRGVSAVQFSKDGSMIASAGADATAKVWDTATGKLIHTFEGHLAGISTVCWTPDQHYIATGSDDKTIRLWDVETGKAHPRAFVGHNNYVYQIAISPKGNMIVSGSYDEAVFIWDIRSARVMKSLPAHSDPVNGVDFVWDGTLIVSCATDGLIRIWDTATGQCLRTLVHEDNPPVTAVKFSPNGKYVLAWSLDDCVRLWDYVKGRCIKTFQGHVNKKYSMVGGFGIYGLPNAPPTTICFAVSGSEDGAILCWDLVTKKILQRIEGHTDVVLGVQWSKFQGKRFMVSCGLDQTVRVWEEMDEEEETATGENAQDPVATDAPENNQVATAEPRSAPNDDTNEPKDTEMTEAPEMAATPGDAMEE